jgi:hypothetical protein
MRCTGRRRRTFLRGGLETKCSVRDAQHVAHRRRIDVHVRRHLRPKAPLGIVDLEDHGIGHDVLIDLCVVPDLRDPAAKFILRVRVDVEARHLPDLHAPDVRLIDVCLYLHLGQVLRDLEERGRLEGCGDCLPNIVLTIDDDTVDGGEDLRVTQVRHRLRKRGLGLLDLRARRLVCSLCRVDVGLRSESGVQEPALALILDARIVGLHLRPRDVRTPLLDLCLERCRIELRQKLALLHGAIEVGVEARDDARDLASDLDVRDGGEGAGRGDGGGHVPAIDFLGFVVGALVSAAFAERQSERKEKNGGFALHGGEHPF